MKTKHRVFFCFFLLMTCIPLWCQDFKLYFANNVSDVVNFSQIESDSLSLKDASGSAPYLAAKPSSVSFKR